MTYNDGSRLPEVFVVPQIRIYPVNAATGTTTVAFDLPVPPQDEPYNVGAVSGDETRPFVVATPGNQLAFDPQGFITMHVLARASIATRCCAI